MRHAALILLLAAAPLSAGQFSPSNISSASLIMHFNENRGTIVRNQANEASSGTLTNNPVWVTGKYGSALKFDSGDVNFPHYVDIVSIAKTMPAGAGPRTIMFLMFQATNPAAGGRQIFCLPCGNGANHDVQITASGNLLTIQHGSNDNAFNMPLPIGQWFGVGYRYENPTDTMIMVTSTKTYVESFNAGAIDTFRSGPQFAIGGGTAGAPTADCRNCYIDEPVVLNQAMPVGEIRNRLRAALSGGSVTTGDD